MIVRLLLAALCAGLIVGVVMTPVQYARVIPLIAQAETFEHGHGHGHSHAAGPSLVGAAQAHEAGGADHAHGSGADHAHAHGEGGHAGGPGRLLGTMLANLVTGAGFALVLAAASLLVAVPITAANGVIWGMAGFAAASLAPALGLPPELPAMPAGDLSARQLWWVATVVSTAAALYCLALRREPWAKVLGMALLFAPHLVGAPRPADLSSPVPPTLAAEFAVAALATAAFFWALLGIAVGWAIERFGAREA